MGVDLSTGSGSSYKGIFKLNLEGLVSPKRLYINPYQMGMGYGNFFHTLVSNENCVDYHN